LLEAGLRRFEANGVEGTSVEDVAEDAGFSKGAVYSNFASKDDLALAILEERVAERVAAIARASGAPRWWAPPPSARSTQADPWDLLFMEMWVRAVRDDAIRQRMAALITKLTAVFEANHRAAGVPEPELLSPVTIALMNGLRVQYTLTRDVRLFDAYAWAMMQLIQANGDSADG
jgi:AcrR family transcriptional regulator